MKPGILDLSFLKDIQNYRMLERNISTIEAYNWFVGMILNDRSLISVYMRDSIAFQRMYAGFLCGRRTMNIPVSS